MLYPCNISNLRPLYLLKAMTSCVCVRYNTTARRAEEHAILVAELRHTLATHQRQRARREADLNEQSVILTASLKYTIRLFWSQCRLKFVSENDLYTVLSPLFQRSTGAVG